MYTTQMDAARKGIITPQMKIVAEKERMDAEEIRSLVAKGQVIIPCNKNHKALHPSGVGARLTTKINVNLGVSRDWKDVDMEYEKVRSAVEMGAEAIMDLSSYGDTRSFRRKLTADCPAMIGTVPIYDAVVYYHKPLAQITAEEWLDIVRMHAEDGVDFMTIHCGMNRATAARFKQNKRLMNIVSRGGSIMFAWMEMTGNENPFYEHYDEILDICREYDITMSLGDACRPGCLADATDTAQIEELITLGELTKRAWAKDVQVMIEGPGHMPMNQIAANMEIQKTLCHGAPFYVLGPLVTDVAPGYDHITSAIGGALAAASGAAFLCYVTPAQCGRCKGRHHCGEDCGTRSRYRKGNPPRGRLGLQNERSKKASGLGGNVPSEHGPRKGTPLQSRGEARKGGYLQHVWQFLCSEKYKSHSGWRNCQHF